MRPHLPRRWPWLQTSGAACSPWSTRWARRRRPMPDLEQQLQDLATAIEWPATPQLRPRLLSTRGEARGRATRWGLWGRPLAVAVAALLIVAVALVAYPPSRT